MKRQFLLLAHNYKPEKFNVSGCFVSEKLDGMRAFWDGGVTRGLMKKDVPWANTEKDSRYKKEPMATGLWSRYGNPIYAPDWWLDQLPTAPLDGELYIPGKRQQLMKTVKKLVPVDHDWDAVNYHIFDMVPLKQIFKEGLIFNKALDPTTIGGFIFKRKPTLKTVSKDAPFRSRLACLEKYVRETTHVKIHPHDRLPMTKLEAERTLYSLLDTVDEGLVVREPLSLWVPHRSHDIVKVKNVDDAEGVITGFIAGREGKLKSLMGAMILDYNGHRLELSGFTEAEREWAEDWMFEAAASAPGEEHPEFECKEFKVGDVVTFKYRGVSEYGVPQEARYWRKRVS